MPTMDKSAAPATLDAVVALIGRDAPLIGAAIDGCNVPVRFCSDLEDAVRWCAAQTQADDAVLLSPACASLDMFRNFEERGRLFARAVGGLS